jgi:phosphatidylglycerol:prolipoprotein diacylglycerol transferase
MHPVLFHFGSFTLYTYGFFIALGAVLGGIYMWQQGKKRYGMTVDQANTLFLLLIFAGVVGGKLFLIFEDTSLYLSHPSELLSKNGFVFYGSLITAIPVMLWYFKKNNLPVAGMLDVMAAVTCIVHGFGRIGCFNAGCCYGTPTQSFLGVVFTDPTCQAQPLNVPLHPTQLYEASAIFLILIILLIIDRKKKFDGQVFLMYLILYAITRSVIELFRGDLERGFVIDNVLSYSQFISILMASAAIYFYVKLKRRANFHLPK